MFRSTSFLLLGVFVLLASVSGPDAACAGDITVVGTGDSQALMRDLAVAYEQANPDSHVVIPDSIGSSGGIRAVAFGHSVMGRTARPLTLQEGALGLTYTVFGYSPVAFIVNEAVTGIDSLTSAQLLAVFRGDISNWSELGGPDQKIYLVNREAGDSSRGVLAKHIQGFADIAVPPDSVFLSTPEAINALARYPHTIGYGPLGMIQPNSMRALSYNGIAPTPENVAKQLYPLATEFGLVWKGDLPPDYQTFVEFLASPQARSIMLGRGVHPVTAQ